MKQSIFPFASEDMWGLYYGYVICLPDMDHYPGGIDTPLSQYGECTNCKVHTVSVAKHAICAVCGNGVYGT